MIKDLIDIYLIFFRMGAVTFGGGYAMLPILRREVVQNHKWMTEEDIMDFYALSQGIPGIIAINVSVFIGYKQRGLLGGIRCPWYGIPMYHHYFHYFLLPVQFPG